MSNNFKHSSLKPLSTWCCQECELPQMAMPMLLVASIGLSGSSSLGGLGCYMVQGLELLRAAFGTASSSEFIPARLVCLRGSLLCGHLGWLVVVQRSCCGSQQCPNHCSMLGCPTRSWRTWAFIALGCLGCSNSQSSGLCALFERSSRLMRGA